jgi:hypothetical protein
VTVQALVGTTDLPDTASKGSRLVLADPVLVAVTKVHEVAKLVHVGSHSTAVAFLRKCSPVRVSKGCPGGFTVLPIHGAFGHAEHDKVIRGIRLIEASLGNAQLKLRCGYNLVLTIAKDVARSNVDGNIYIHDSTLHSVTCSGGPNFLSAERAFPILGKDRVGLGIGSNERPPPGASTS